MHKRLFGALLCGALLMMTGCGLLPKEEEEAPPVLAAPVKSEKETYTAKVGDIADVVSLRGRFAPARAEDLSFKGSGRVKAVYVRSGDRVEKGQVVAELHNEDAVLGLAQAQIRFERAKLALEDERNKAQYSRGAAVEGQIRRAELDLELARLDVEKASRQVEESRLVAPFSGQVTAVAAKVGDQAQPYAAVVNLADPTELIVEADVDDSALSRGLSVGQKARLDFSDLGAPVTGTIVELPPASGASPKRIKVKLDEPAPRAALGMVGKVNVVLQEKQGVVLLPNAAIRQYSGRTYVLLKNPRREVDVVLGIQGDLGTEITKGLQAGDQVIGR